MMKNITMVHKWLRSAGMIGLLFLMAMLFQTQAHGDTMHPYQRVTATPAPYATMTPTPTITPTPTSTPAPTPVQVNRVYLPLTIR